MNACGRKLQNVEEVVAFLWEKLNCKPKTSYSREQTLMHKVFWHVKKDDVNRDEVYTCAPIEGVMKVHSICYVGPLHVTKL